MNKGFYKRSYIDLVVSRTGRYDLVDAYVFGQFMADVWGGYLMTCEVGFLGKVSGPEGDKEESENNRLLSRLVPPFRGTFKGQTHGGDGSIEWTEPITLERRIPGDDQRRESIEVPPRPLLLEVGNLHLYNGWHHLQGETGFARWPYNSDTITIMLWHESKFEERDCVGTIRIPVQGKGKLYREVPLNAEAAGAAPSLYQQQFGDLEGFGGLTGWRIRDKWIDAETGDTMINYEIPS
jgi:hypothetical protein